MPLDDARAAALAPTRAAGASSLEELDQLVSTCRACPRLVQWREQVGREKRSAFRDETYWARPVPGFGPADSTVLIVGLAPAAHGGNRTGRMFTGDRSGDFLFAALHELGLASQAEATSKGDGLELRGVRMTSPVHCAPPANKPTPTERRTCAPFLSAELNLLRDTLKVAVVLGGFGWQALLSSLADDGWETPRPRPKFGHGARVDLHHPSGRSLTVLGCYHVSQQNTFTGRLTPAMLRDVLRTAKQLASAN